MSGKIMQNIINRTWTEIDLFAVRHNFFEVQKLCSKNDCINDNTENLQNQKINICCVIKADGYGHGATKLAQIYESLGVNFFAVSNIDEAISLRNDGINSKILILGYTPISFAKILSDQNVSQCVYSYEYAKELSQKCKEENCKINIHIKADTGMSRLGFYYQNPKEDFLAVSQIKEVCSFENFVAEGIFTHFAESDSGNDNFTLKQFANFNDLIEQLSDIKFPFIHCANSAGIMDFKETHFNMVRAGIMLYGLAPSSDMRTKTNLLPVMSLKSVISHIKTIKKGATVSYGRNFTADTDLKIATIPVGYADGYSRRLSKLDTDVLINGQRRRIIGNICMDQLMVLLEKNDKVEIGDTVTLIGTENGQSITVDELAEKLSTINYEIVCNLKLRASRIFVN